MDETEGGPRSYPFESPPMIRLTSLQSMREVAETGGPTVRPNRRAQKRAPDPVAAALGRVYSAWNDGATAPWVGADASAPAARPSGKRKRYASKGAKRRNNAQTLVRFDLRLRAEIGRPRTRDTSLVGYGGTVPGLAPAASRANGRVFKITVVFWSPTHASATAGGHLSVAGYRNPRSVGNEGLLVECINKFLDNRTPSPIKKGKIRSPVQVTVAYVVPAWRKQQQPRQPSGGYTPKFDSTPPDLLAAGLWQLRQRLAYIRPHVVLSVSQCVARMVGATDGLNPSLLLTEALKIAARERTVLGRESQQAVTMAGAPDDRGSGPVTFVHIRCPHPYSMFRTPSGTGSDRAAVQADKAWGARVMDRVAAVRDEAFGTSSSSSGAAAQRILFVPIGRRHRARPPPSGVNDPIVDDSNDQDTESESDDDDGPPKKQQKQRTSGHATP